MHSRQKVNYTIALAKKYGAKIHILGLLDKDDATDPKKFHIKIACPLYIRMIGLIFKTLSAYYSTRKVDDIMQFLDHKDLAMIY